MMTAALAIAAAAVAVVPFLSRMLQARGASAPRHATYEDSIRAISAVRGRLLATDLLGEKERGAVDALTLALVAGSDHE